MIQQMLAIWSLIPLPFLNPSWTSGYSQFMYCWSLTWRILSINVVVWTFVCTAFLWEENGYKYMYGWVPSLSPETITTLFVNLLFIPRWGFPHESEGKESACNVGHPGSTPGWGRSPGEGNGNPLQYSCLENSMDRGPWRATVHGVAESQILLGD